jgi:hypothetical protein
MVTFKTFFNLILEDLKSSINQANKILTSNEFSPEEASQAVDKIKGIMDEVGRGVSNQQKRFNTDSNIPILSYILLALKDAGGDPYAKLKREYQTYLASEEATNKKILTIAFDKLRNEIQGKKLFKPSPEKTQIIVSWGTNLIEEIHKYIKADKTEAPAVKGGDDVVYENDDIVVYRADSKNKCIAYGAGSNLCISVKGGGNYYWAYRMGEMRRGRDNMGMTTYFVFWKDTNERILIDALGDEDGPANKYSWNNIEKDGKYDNADADITPEELIEMHPELQEPFFKNVFQFIPYGEDERRFMEIQENVGNNINSPFLTSMQDYDMFLEGYERNIYERGYVDIPMYDWMLLEDKLPKKNVDYLVKKYAGLDFNVDVATQKRYLSESDRNWYLSSVVGEREDQRDIVGYIVYTARYEDITDILYKKLSILDGGLGIYVVLSHIFSHDYEDLQNKFSPETVYNIFVGKMDDQTFDHLRRYMESLYDPMDAIDALISFYNNTNKKIPKELYKFIIKDPRLSFNAALNWVHRVNEIPNILIKSAIKDPRYALEVAVNFFKGDEYGIKQIPAYVKRAVFAGPPYAYEFIHKSVDGMGFVNYPTSEIVDLFSKNGIGFRYAEDHHGFGTFNRKNNINDQRVRRAIYKSIMDSGYKSKMYVRNDYIDVDNPANDFEKMVKRSAARYSK